MTFWGFLFTVLIVFVALYAWYRFRNNRGPADLGDVMFGEIDRERQRAQDGTRRNHVVISANRPMLMETGTIGEFDDPVQQAPVQQNQSQAQAQRQTWELSQRVRAHQAGQKKPRDLGTQLFLSEIGSIGDVTRQPVALLPAPQGATQTLADQEHAYSSAVASESIGSNLSQSQTQANEAPYEAQWLENSDLEHLKNAGNGNNRFQGANFDATYGDNAASAGSYMQAQTQSYQTEVGTIGEQENLAPFVNQAPRTKEQRRGYIHKSDVEFGSQGDMEGLYNLPDQLPVLNNTNFNDPNCK